MYVLLPRSNKVISVQEQVDYSFVTQLRVDPLPSESYIPLLFTPPPIATENLGMPEDQLKSILEEFHGKPTSFWKDQGFVGEGAILD